MKLTAKLLSLLLALAMLLGMTAGLAEEDAVELTIFCTLDSNSGIDANNLWWWRYAESRLAQKGMGNKTNPFTYDHDYLVQKVLMEIVKGGTCEA